MRVITDFHLHSRWSRACSKSLTIKQIAAACERKGIRFAGTSDFTHPAWREEIERELIEMDGHAYGLREGAGDMRFLLSSEISCIYKRAGKTRRLHHLILFPTLAGVDRFTKALLDRGCNLKSDGRPIIGIDSEELLKIVLDADPKGMLIPAHAWTPWFGVFGSQSGFDALQECFGDLTPHIKAIETGLSSDPAMNHRLRELDQIFLVSNSDAHSLDKLGREASVFEMAFPSYDALYDILMTHDVSRFVETIEFFPEEGKYHVDGHRACAFWCDPKETEKKYKSLCPVCGKPLTIGVLHRIEALANREEKDAPSGLVPYRSIIPLAEIVADVLGARPTTQKVQRELQRLMADGRTEFGILLDLAETELVWITSPEIVQGIMNVRGGRVRIQPGYDGQYGTISVTDKKGTTTQQGSLFA